MGRAAYIWTGTKSFRKPAFEARIKVDGSPWYERTGEYILAGNVGSLFAGMHVFADAEPDDGLVELAVITAEGMAQWARTAPARQQENPSGRPSSA